MSGGSMDYVYSRVLEASLRLKQCNTGPSIHPDAATLREWMVQHLDLVAAALHDIEWVDSDDYSPGDEVSALKAVVRHLHSAPEES